jgi:histidine triad (HIT) family protein
MATMTHSSDCVFCRIVSGLEPAWIIWEDKDYVAFLTPYPNTKGFTVLASREHLPSYILDLDDNALFSFVKAAKVVAKLLDQALGTKRTAMVAEGMGIDHAHLKLIPLHGIPDGPWQPVLSNVRTQYTSYPGYVASHDGPRTTDEDLDSVASLIRSTRMTF